MSDGSDRNDCSNHRNTSVKLQDHISRMLQSRDQEADPTSTIRTDEGLDIKSETPKESVSAAVIAIGFKPKDPLMFFFPAHFRREILEELEKRLELTKPPIVNSFSPLGDNVKDAAEKGFVLVGDLSSEPISSESNDSSTHGLQREQTLEIDEELLDAATRNGKFFQGQVKPESGSSEQSSSVCELSAPPEELLVSSTSEALIETIEEDTEAPDETSSHDDIDSFLSGFLANSESREILDSESESELGAVDSGLGSDSLLELRKLHDSGSFEELALRCEEILASGPSPLVRIYWLKSQLELGLVPLAILSAPLEELVSQSDATVYFEARDMEVFESLLLAFAEREEQEGRHHTAHKFLARACKIEPAHAARLATLIELRISELEGLPSYRITPEQELLLSELRNELKQLDYEKPKRISHSIPSEQLRSKPAFLFRLDRNSRAYVLICSLVLLGASSWFFFADVEVSQSSQYGDGSLIQSFSAPELLLPVVELRDKPGAIDALFYEVSANSDASASKTQGGSQAQQQDSPQFTKLGPLAPPKKKKVQKSFRRLKLDLSGPVEPPELAKLFDLARQQRVARKKVRQPRIDENFVRSGGLDDSSSVIESSSASSKGMYEVITETTVVVSPSYKSKAMAKLSKGAKVEVAGGEGEWMRIRSKKGRYGYILSQDLKAVD